MKFVYGIGILAAVALSVSLFFNEEVAKPGPLSTFHEEIAQCKDCHIPWHGVSELMCLECHEFADPSLLRPEIRFHEAEKHCLKCHTEHRGLQANISKTDHTLFSGKLQCTQCHTDIHSGLFGGRCRECHGLETWDVPGFKHPPEDKMNCNRCHKPPYSHLDKSFWGKIEMTHGETLQDIQHGDCWRCHTTRYWRHLMMSHPMGNTRSR